MVRSPGMMYGQDQEPHDGWKEAVQPEHNHKLCPTHAWAQLGTNVRTFHYIRSDMIDSVHGPHNEESGSKRLDSYRRGKLRIRTPCLPFLLSQL